MSNGNIGSSNAFDMCPICLETSLLDGLKCRACGFAATKFIVKPDDFASELARVPSEEMMLSVANIRNPATFLYSGHQTVESFCRALDYVDRRLRDYTDILDFGAGCGRLLRWMIPKVPAATWSACDIDEAGITWIRNNVSGARTDVINPMPPLAYPDESFDLVIGFSVFTHLPPEMQDAWLVELRRVIRPGGTLMVTVHGMWAFADASSRVPWLREQSGAFERDGVVYWPHANRDGAHPSYYQATYHHPEYIRKHWGQWFDNIVQLERATYSTHDVVIARRPSETASTQ